MSIRPTRRNGSGPCWLCCSGIINCNDQVIWMACSILGVGGAGGVTRAISDTTDDKEADRQAGKQASRRSNGNKVEHNYNWNNESRARKPGQVGWSEASSWRRCSSDLNLTMCYYCLPLFAYQIQNDQVQTWIACGSSGCSCVCARRSWCRLKNGRKSIWGRRSGTWQQAAKIQQIPNLPCRYSYQYSVCVCVSVRLCRCESVW